MVAICALGALNGACSVYDPELVTQEAAATRPPPELTLDSGTRPVPDIPSRPDSGQSPGPDQTPDATVEPPRPDVCGDGRVSGDELCDTGIDEGEPGACPPEVCEPLSECGLRARRGEACQSACVLLPETCSNGDRCCPAQCTSAEDDDCSASCGDGVVQDEQETCEPGSAMGCPVEADCDDDDPCTTDSLQGSAENCNAVCINAPITTLVGGDQCCPEGANANTDPDCVARCGNGVREAGEECDGTADCTEQCMLRNTPQQRQCLEQFAEDECMRCACMACTQQALGCYASGDATRDMHCAAINRCARENDCTRAACYCGTAWGCLAPDGPCVTPIHAAATTPEPLEVEADRVNPETPIGRADLLGTCALTQCANVCP